MMRSGIKSRASPSRRLDHGRHGRPPPLLASRWRCAHRPRTPRCSRAKRSTRWRTSWPGSCCSLRRSLAIGDLPGSSTSCRKRSPRRTTAPAGATPSRRCACCRCSSAACCGRWPGCGPIRRPVLHKMAYGDGPKAEPSARCDDAPPAADGTPNQAIASRGVLSHGTHAARHLLVHRLADLLQVQVAAVEHRQPGHRHHDSRSSASPRSSCCSTSSRPPPPTCASSTMSWPINARVNGLVTEVPIEPNRPIKQGRGAVQARPATVRDRGRRLRGAARSSCDAAAGHGQREPARASASSCSMRAAPEDAIAVAAEARARARGPDRASSPPPAPAASFDYEQAQTDVAQPAGAARCRPPRANRRFARSSPPRPTAASRTRSPNVKAQIARAEAQLADARMAPRTDRLSRARQRHRGLAGAASRRDGGAAADDARDDLRRRRAVDHGDLQAERSAQDQARARKRRSR